MTGLEIMFALIFAALLSFLLISLFGASGPGPWGGILVLFLILFLGIWGIGGWIRPIGPAIWGAYWLGFLWIGLIIALIIAAFSPSSERKFSRKAYSMPTGSGEAAVSRAIGVLFWVLLAVLVISIIAALV